MGSLVAALASYLDARAAGGKWLLRIEDLDPPREVAGASTRILSSLDAHGLHWDEEVRYQSQRSAHYEAALSALSAAGLTFPCSCTRATLGSGGSCGRRCEPGANDSCSTRLELRGTKTFDDVFLGEQHLTQTQKDQILKRKDGLYAYALAVVIDDADQGITRVVRGMDLLDQTPAQQYLHRCLDQAPPEYGHVPLLRNAEGHKFSKQTGAPALDDTRPMSNLRRALQLLGQREVDSHSQNDVDGYSHSDVDDSSESVAELLVQAVSQWQPEVFRDADREVVYRDEDSP